MDVHVARDQHYTAYNLQRDGKVVAVDMLLHATHHTTVL